MLQAPTSEVKAETAQSKSQLVPQPEQELHPRLLSAAGPYSSSGMNGVASGASSEAQRRQTLAGMQSTHGNQAVLRMLQSPQQVARMTSLRPSQGIMLQRKCACGGSSEAEGECAECKAKGEGTLQRSAANPTVSPAVGAIQTKLAINKPGDQYEQEADRVAEQVMTMPAHHVVSCTPPHIQCFSGQSYGPMNAAPASVDQALASPGKPLELALRQDMEQRFGHDFSRVLVHSGASAEQSAQDVNANAYTVGHDMVFGTGRFAPGTHEGRRLIAHELTHVVQQSGADGIYTGQSNEKRDLSSIQEVAGMSRPSPRPVAVSAAAPSAFVSRDVSNPKVPMTISEEVVELKGNRYFSPSAALAKSIKDSVGIQQIWVQFGKIARGILPVRFEKDGYATADLPPSMPGHPLEVTHESFQKLRGATPVIAVQIRKGEVEGTFGWKLQNYYYVDPEEFLDTIQPEELFGWDGFTDVVITSELVENTLRNGHLRFRIPIFSFRNGHYKGTGKFQLLDETATFEAGVDVNVTGLPSAARLPVKQEHGALHGLYGSKTWNFNRMLGKAGKDDDMPGASRAR